MISIMASNITKIPANLKQFFEKENSQQQPMMPNNILSRMELATGMNERSIHRHQKLSTTNSKNRGRPKINLDEFDLRAISRKIHQFHQKEFQTLDKLHVVLRDDTNVKGYKSKLLKGVFFFNLESYWLKIQSKKVITAMCSICRYHLLTL